MQTQDLVCSQTDFCFQVMVEIGKRQQRDNDSDGRQQKKRFVNNDGTRDSELVVYRILCPLGVIGSVIGKSGKIINSIRQETNAKIKIVDPFPGADKRVITIYCYVKDKNPVDVDEDILRPLCPAQDALLKIHDAIVNALDNSNEFENKQKEGVYILVPASQAANIIGKSGSIIKKLRSKTNANIKITPKDPSDATHSCAMSFDNFLQVINTTSYGRLSSDLKMVLSSEKLQVICSLRVVQCCLLLELYFECTFFVKLCC